MRRIIGESVGIRGKDEKRIVRIIGGGEIDARTPFQRCKEGRCKIHPYPARHSVPAIPFTLCSWSLHGWFSCFFWLTMESERELREWNCETKGTNSLWWKLGYNRYYSILFCLFWSTRDCCFYTIFSDRWLAHWLDLPSNFHIPFLSFIFFLFWSSPLSVYIWVYVCSISNTSCSFACNK